MKTLTLLYTGNKEYQGKDPNTDHNARLVQFKRLTGRRDGYEEAVQTGKQIQQGAEYKQSRQDSHELARTEGKH